MYRKIALSLISVSLCVAPLGAITQGVKDCRAPEDCPPLAGHVGYRLATHPQDLRR